MPDLKVGQLLMVGFPGLEVGPEIKRLIAERHIGGICLFARNIASPEQVRELNADLQSLAKAAGDPPLLISIDQEGGTVQRLLEPATEWPGNMALGATGSAELAREAAAATALELRAVGCNWDLAPDLDVNNNPANPIIGVRSFGGDPALVAELGVAAISGYQQNRVIACGKHFPGHGDTAQDSHLTLPTVPHSLERLHQVELVPFKAAIEEGIDSIMTTHITFPSVDPTPGLPATLSKPALTGLLREQLGFNGVIICDAMEMEAIAGNFGIGDATVMAVLAGADMVPVCSGLERQFEAHDALTAAVNNGRLSRERVEQSIARLTAMRKKYDLTRHRPKGQPGLDVVGAPRHQAIAREIAERSITKVRDSKGHVPISISPDQDLLAVWLNDLPRTPAESRERATAVFGDAIRERHARLRSVLVSPDPNDEEIAAAVEAAQGCALIIAGTINLHLNPGQKKMIEALTATNLPLVWISFASPYDLNHFPQAETYLCAYSWRPASVEAAVRVLFGEIEATGKLPTELG